MLFETFVSLAICAMRLNPECPVPMNVPTYGFGVNLSIAAYIISPILMSSPKAGIRLFLIIHIAEFKNLVALMMNLNHP